MLSNTNTNGEGAIKQAVIESVEVIKDPADNRGKLNTQKASKHKQ